MREQTFELCGEIDLASREELVRRLDVMVRFSGDDLAIDCRGLTFMDSSGVAALVEAQNRLGDQGRRLRLLHLGGSPRLVIDTLGLAAFFSLDPGPT